MVRDPVAVDPGLTLGRFVDEVVWARRFTTYPVVDDGQAVGLLPFRSVARVPAGEWEHRTVGECMVPLRDVPTLAARTTPLVEALDDLAGSVVRRGLVLDGGRLVGLLSITDLALSARDAPRTVELWGGRWDSNPRPPGPQPGALPAELRPPRRSQCSRCYARARAPVAQWTERRTSNPRVAGSNPARRVGGTPFKHAAFQRRPTERHRGVQHDTNPGLRAENVHRARGDEQHGDGGDRRLEAHSRLRTQRQRHDVGGAERDRVRQ